MLVNTKGLRLECERMLDEGLLTPALIYRCKTMVWRKKERSRIRVVQMENFKEVCCV